MYIYTFTNDLRNSLLEGYLGAVSEHLETGIWDNDNTTLVAAKNGLYQSYEQYFGLKKGLSNTNLILQGEEALIIKEFVKKFQYPNPRETRERKMIDIVNNNQFIFPLRVTIKLLFRMAQNMGKSTASINNHGFRTYILTNPHVAEGSENIQELEEFILTNPFPSYSTDFEIVGAGQRDDPHYRFIKTLFEVAGKLPFLNFTYYSKTYCELSIDFSELDDMSKYMLGDILSSVDRWEDYPDDPSDWNQKKLMESYKEYMQVIPGFRSTYDLETELGKSNGEETNIIYYGAPGTGKSYEVNTQIKKEYKNYDDSLELEESQYVFRTTIHNDFSYYDFVGQIMPTTDYLDKDKIKYEFNPGIFTNALIKAYTNPSKKVFLILEEMSRGNITSIFGDIFQILDRDINTGISEIGITNNILGKEILTQQIISRDDITEVEKNSMIANLSEDRINNYFIKLPGNLYIYGTLNTSDQSVFPMDSAFKRRFSFKYISLDPILDKNSSKARNNFEFKLEDKIVNWIPFFQGINKFIQLNMEVAEDKYIGQFLIIGKLLDEQAIIEPDLSSEELQEKIIQYNTEQIKDKLLNFLFTDIERHLRISNTNVSIFKKGKASFSQIYTDFSYQENVFSQELLNQVFEFSIEDSSDLEDSSDS